MAHPCSRKWVCGHCGEGKERGQSPECYILPTSNTLRHCHLPMDCILAAGMKSFETE